MYRRFIALALFFGALSFANAQGSDADHAAEVTAIESSSRFKQLSATMLEGIWAGALPMRRPLSKTDLVNDPDPADLELRIEIKGKDVQVYLKEKGKWIEAMPGKFFALPAFTNVQIMGVNSQADSPTNAWVESWSIQFASLDDDTVLVEWSRAVTNTSSDKNVQPAFTSAASGLMRRQQP